MSDSIDRLRAALSDRYQVERELGEGGMATVRVTANLQHTHILPPFDSGEADGFLY